MRCARRTGILVGLGFSAALLSCDREVAAPTVVLFHAAGFGPVVRQIRDACERDLGITLQAEGSGTQEACRKITELGRACDVLVLADNRLVGEILGAACPWRIDFATDAMVLGVGVRAPRVADAERDWPAVILGDDVRLARVDENLGPAGYRTLLALKLQERLGCAGLHDGFLARCRMKMDDVERLVPLLRTGEIDYAFLYRSTAIAHGVRYIGLDKRVDLGAPDGDYGGVEVCFAKLKAGARESVAIRGAPIVWSVVEPRGSASPQRADRLVEYIIAKQAGALEGAGFRALTPPLFHGPRDAYARFSGVAEYGGGMR